MESRSEQQASQFGAGLRAAPLGDEGVARERSSNWGSMVLKSSTGTFAKVKRSGSAVSGVSTERLEHMTTIHNLEILKGIPICFALGSFGRLFGMGGDPVENMAMAKGVTRLDDFISHNWVVPRLTKWCALMLHYNVRPACLAAVSAVLFVSALLLLGILPPTDGPTRFQRVNWNFVLAHLVFWAVLLFWQDIKRNLPQSMQVKERMGFVDKSCIHQTEKEKMLEGIRNLAGFLRMTQHMVVCVGPTYFRKLWTVYEIASFLSIHRDPTRIKLYPTTWAKPLFITGILLVSVQSISKVAFLLDPQAPVTVMVTVFSVVQVAIFVYALRQTVRAHEQILEDLSQFDIRHAMCAVESDRAVVEGNVSAFMREMGRVPEHAEQEEALDAFNELVHTEFYSSASDQGNTLTFVLLFQAFGVVTNLARLCDDLVEYHLFAGRGWEVDAVVPGDTFSGVAWFVRGLDSLYMGVLMSNVCLVPLLSRRTHLKGWREFLYLYLSCSAGLFVVAPVVPVLTILAGPSLDARNEASVRWRSLILTFLCHAILFGLTVWTSLRPPCPKRRSEKLGNFAPGVSVAV